MKRKRKNNSAPVVAPSSPALAKTEEQKSADVSTGRNFEEMVKKESAFLDRDVFRIIFWFCDAAALFACMGTCKEWRKILSKDKYWKTLPFGTLATRLRDKVYFPNERHWGPPCRRIWQAYAFCQPWICEWAFTNKFADYRYVFSYASREALGDRGWMCKEIVEEWTRQYARARGLDGNLSYKETVMVDRGCVGWYMNYVWLIGEKYGIGYHFRGWWKTPRGQFYVVEVTEQAIKKYSPLKREMLLE